MSQAVIRDDQFIAAAVKAQLSRRGLSQAALARDLEVTENFVSRRLRAEVSFSAVELAKVAEVLDVPVHELLGRAA